MNRYRRALKRERPREHLSPPELERLIKNKQLRRKRNLSQKLKLKLSQNQIEKLRVWRLIWKNQPDVEPKLTLKEKVRQAKAERQERNGWHRSVKIFMN